MQRARIVVKGVVQGVGFRPFVYRLAGEYRLNGWVLNSTEGVVIEVEGDGIESFVADLEAKRPPLARVDHTEVTFLPPIGHAGFAIGASAGDKGAVALVSPDVSTCDNCLSELLDPADRRFLYPFINCTNCGPRFTIVRDIPYDRPKTTMSAFTLCARCQAEYDDPNNRRFHAQPNACPDCGPSVLLEHKGSEVGGTEAIERTRALLRDGLIVAVKGLGGFHLACDATDERAVATLRGRKRRVEKPFAVMVADLAAAEQLCVVSEAEQSLLLSPQRPIVLLRRRSDCSLAASVAPGNAYLGLMLPYTPLHHLLLRDGMPPLVMTSGNQSEEPIATDNVEATEQLGDLADAFLLHDREIHVRCDDSVTRVVDQKETIIRRSRGYAPFPVRFLSPMRQVLACGAELKNTFCVTREDYAFLSHHIGDMENAETLASFEEGIEHFCRLFRVSPEAIAHDLHPDYLSTRYAIRQRESGRVAPERVFGVQHHHAHVASCLAENGLEGEVIGVAFDGTGYGPDGGIWGGEFLLASFAGYTRLGHLAYVPLPGGDAAIRRPYRTALSYAYATFGSMERALALLRSHTDPGVMLGDAEVSVLARQVGGGLNAPRTSSVGRLFDAVAALAGLRLVVNYEAQAAIELEAAAAEAVTGAYSLPVVKEGVAFTLDPRPLIAEVVADVESGVGAGVVSARFHNALAAAVVAGCRLARQTTGLQRVALSGGVFQNQLLLRLVVAGLEREGFSVYTHHQVPTNDGGISLGQAAVANARLQARCTN